MGFVKLELAGKQVKHIVIITRVVKYKVANFVSTNTKLPQRRKYDLTHPLTRVSACELRQRDRQVLKLAVNHNVVGDDTNKPALAAFCRLSVKT